MNRFYWLCEQYLKNADKKGQNPILGIGKMGLKNSALKQPLTPSIIEYSSQSGRKLFPQKLNAKPKNEKFQSDEHFL